jgi:multidrug efflux pump subunit AcrA (membrane-fusion protein)
MRKTIISILIGIVVIIASYFIMNRIIDSKTNRRPQAKKVIKTVFVDTVKNSTVPIVISANGNLVAKRRVELFSEVQGVFRPSSKLFKAGQEYRVGQTLIQIDASEYYASVQSAKSNLFNLVTSIMPDLQLDYPEHFSKWKEYVTSFDLGKATPKLPEINSEKEKFFISGRGILTSYYNVKNLEQRLSKYTITAPFNGILTEALVTEGTLVRVGQKLGEYINTGKYELEVAIGKTYGDLLQVGKQVTLNNLERTKTYVGKVVRVNGRVDQATQTVTAFIEVTGNGLKEGQYLEANLQASEATDAIKINRSLLVANNSLYIVRDSLLDVIEVSPVFFGEKDVVIQNVPNGTAIVSKPLPGAYSGMLVKVYQEQNSAE